MQIQSLKAIETIHMRKVFVSFAKPCTSIYVVTSLNFQNKSSETPEIRQSAL